jgi:Mn2+/Fe2+ NRAMP family transporter
MAQGLIPHVPSLSSRGEYLSYAYFAVALLSSIMLPYETYFYASGGIEDDWNTNDVPVNRLVAIVGFSLGCVLAGSLVIMGAELYSPHEIEPQLAGSAALGPIIAYGKLGLLMALLGMLFAFGGAAIENCLSLAYNVAQYFDWPWGKHRKPKDVPRFSASWVVILVLATAIILTGVDPVSVVEYSIVFSVVILPLSYLPILRAARDKKRMGRFANGLLANTLGIFYFILISLAAVAAIPLLIITHSGKT